VSRWIRVGLAVAIGLAGLGLARAEPWDAAQYEAWLADHVLQVVVVLQLPDQFTLADLRDLTIEQQRLLDEVAVVEPPARYAALHARYQEALEAVAQFQRGLQTVVLTRSRVPGLGDRLAAALAALARFVGEARAEGVLLPDYLVALLAPGADVAPAPSALAEPPAGVVPAAPAPAPAEPTCAARDVCAREGGMEARAVGSPRMLPAGREPERLVAVFLQLANGGQCPLVAAPGRFVLEASGGRRAVASHVGLVPLGSAGGLVVAPGQARSGVVLFRVPGDWAAARPWQLRMAVPDGGALVVRLPEPR
jgi:hypothetical protein